MDAIGATGGVCVIIVLGSMPIVDDDGNTTIDSEYRHGIEIAMQEAQKSILARYKPIIVLTGGCTVKGLPAESVVAYEYLSNQYRGFKEYLENRGGKVLTEEHSRTTPENITLTLEILKKEGITPAFVWVIGRSSQLPKTMVIIWRLWDLGKPRFFYASTLDGASWWWKAIDIVVMPPLGVVDPHFRCVGRILRRLRNG